MNEYLIFISGILCAAIGGELFVRGVVGLASWARIPTGIIGATVAAFATSSPEFAVSVSAAAAGTPHIALGDALGSNIVNVGLILACTLLFSALKAPRDSIKRAFPIALLAPVVIGAFAIDGSLSRIDGVILIGMFFAWLVAVVLEVRRQRSMTAEVVDEQQSWVALVLSLVGLALLVAAGRLIVSGAEAIATAFGLDEFIVGATVVALGTSAPELATAVIAKIRGHDEIGLGTILGSNIFNSLCIVAVTCVIAPIVVTWRELMVGLIFGVVTVAVTFPLRGGLIERRRGVILLALYIAYITTILQFR